MDEQERPRFSSLIEQMAHWLQDRTAQGAAEAAPTLEAVVPQEGGK